MLMEKTVEPGINTKIQSEGTFITSATETVCASIYYTLNGTTPTEESSLYV